MSTFSELGLASKLVERLDQQGYETPTAVQEKAIPAFKKNNGDMIVQAQTGTGKTAAFGLPILEQGVSPNGSVRALILTPTRELALQVAKELGRLNIDPSLSIVSIVGGMDIGKQIQGLKRNATIVVGTPGRLIDHVKRKTLKLGDIQTSVLDEADEMLQQGFVEEIEDLLSHCPEKTRLLFFSATMPREVKRLAETYMDEPENIQIERTQGPMIDQIYFEVKARDKEEALCRLIDQADEMYAIIFCRTKLMVDELTERLRQRRYGVEALHGDLSQSQRNKVLNQFRQQRCKLLVATDAAARGIDVSQLTHVINFSFPQDDESYVHRIGRTGRAGKTGIAITLITPNEHYKWQRLQKTLKVTVKKHAIPSIDAVVKAKEQQAKAKIEAIIANEVEPEYQEMADTLMTEHDPKVVIAAMVKQLCRNAFDRKAYQKMADLFQQQSRGSREPSRRKPGFRGKRSGGYKGKFKPARKDRY
ncbi:MAG: RNA helicase [Actinobacteria bacterium]|nr:RNA helicase [Actinomycetota bacterium]